MSNLKISLSAGLHQNNSKKFFYYHHLNKKIFDHIEIKYKNNHIIFSPKNLNSDQAISKNIKM